MASDGRGNVVAVICANVPIETGYCADRGRSGGIPTFILILITILVANARRTDVHFILCSWVTGSCWRIGRRGCGKSRGGGGWRRRQSGCKIGIQLDTVVD